MSTPRILQRIRAKKPTPAAKPTLDEAKKLLDTSATTNRNLFIAFNLVLVTALILCLGINDEQLLIGTAPIPLPFLNVTLPIWAFASVVPLLVLVVHFDLLHNLNEHSRKLKAWVAAWEEKYPPADATSKNQMAVSDQLYPFLYDFAWLHANGKGPHNINARLLPALCWAMYCWAPYTVLVIFLIRFADLQSYFFTAWHLLLILLDVAWLVWYWPRFGAKRVAFWLWRWVRKVMNLRVLLLGVSSMAGCWTLWLYGLIQMHLDFDWPADKVEWAIEVEDKIQPIFGITLVPRLTVPNYRVKLEDKHFQIAKIMAPEKSDAQLWENTAPPLDLSGRRFGFAVFSFAVMPRVDFSHAKLKAARLFNANLKGAKFGNAELQGTYLSSAQLQGADLSQALLLDAELRYAQLQGAYLSQAQFQGANLSQALLQGADLSDAQLQGAYLNFTQLQGTNLRDAQLQGAELRTAQLQGAELSQAQLQGAYLDFAQLQGADLRATQLQGAYLDFAQLRGADLRQAQLQGADLRGLNIVGANLEKVALYGSTLPNLAQFAGSSGTPNLSKSAPLVAMLKQGWAKSLSPDKLKKLTEAWIEIDKRNKIWAEPKLPPKDAKKFALAWLQTVCNNELVAKAMLVSNSRVLPTEITDTTLRQWMQTHGECKPYQGLAEQAMKKRAAPKVENKL